MIRKNSVLALIWAGRKTRVHRAAGNFPAIFFESVVTVWQVEI